ncbi:AraC family transcriptional regulator [Pseudonocardia acidicola]|uniref:AraC family transcriptional regulator n=1 Tax=Pseudonocardia acidicola TaxID=2724939 RepID=A0ABX1S703_9PSEU|nr:AraC family transcriptional regulator [Pseudonocardia acidicola]NMH97340.1 AraC family transcriptional regulator [Pseudonocardia acidicola]
MHSSALDEVREIVPRVYAPHQTIVLERKRHLRAVLNAAVLGDVTVGYLSYGTEIRMIPAPLSSCYHINVPRSGFTESTCGHSSIISSTGRAAVFSPDQPMTIRWSPDCAQLAVKLDRNALQTELENILGQRVSTVRFELGMDVTTSAGYSWLASLYLLLAEMERPQSVIHQPLAGAHFARLLMTTLLFAQQHNHSEALTRPAVPVRPRAVQQVMELVDARPEVPYSAGDLAAHAGVSLRALQAGFRRQLGMSPMAYLTEVRLRRVHMELMDADRAELTTTEVAYRWGFTHLGRFAAAYRKKYGVAPSDTLRRMH